jgi:hypothetical protein
VTGLIGLTGVALCHDIFVAPVFMRTRRRLGLAGLAAVLAAHVGLAFEVVFAGHAGSMHTPGNGSQFSATLFCCEGVHRDRPLRSAISSARATLALSFSNRRILTMDIAERAHGHVLSPRAAVRSHDGWIIAGYLAFAVVACVAIYLAGSGPGMSADDLAAMAGMPLP